MFLGCDNKTKTSIDEHQSNNTIIIQNKIDEELNILEYLEEKRAIYADVFESKTKSCEYQKCFDDAVAYATAVRGLSNDSMKKKESSACNNLLSIITSNETARNYLKAKYLVENRHSSFGYSYNSNKYYVGSSSSCDRLFKKLIK
jgi:hypothetical protein